MKVTQLQSREVNGAGDALIARTHSSKRLFIEKLSLRLPFPLYSSQTLALTLFVDSVTSRHHGETGSCTVLCPASKRFQQSLGEDFGLEDKLCSI